jgi:hypothetical protein
MAMGNTFMDMLSRALLNTTSEGIKGVPTNQDLEKIKSMMPEVKTASEGIKGVPTNQDLEKIKSMMPEVKTASDSNIDRIMESLLEKYLDMGLSLGAATEAAKKEFESRSAGIKGTPSNQDMKKIKDLMMMVSNDKGDFNYLLEQLKNLKPSEDNYGVDQEILLQDIRRLEGLNPTVSIRPKTDYSYAEGGIVSLAEGGDPLYEMFEEVWENTPASERATGSVKKATVRVTGDPLSYRNFLKDLGFIKTAEAADVKALGKYGVKIGDKIGSISEAARALNIKPFELRSDENFAKLTKLAEDKGVKGFTTVGGAGKASISAVEDAATGIGFRGADPGGEKIKFNQVIKAEQKDLNKIFGSNPSKAKSFEFVKRLSSAYPTLAKGAGLTALLSAAAKNAFGGPLLDLAIPTEMGMGTLMSPEEEALLISKEKIKEKFK